MGMHGTDHKMMGTNPQCPVHLGLEDNRCDLLLHHFTVNILSPYLLFGEKRAWPAAMNQFLCIMIWNFGSQQRYLEMLFRVVVGRCFCHLKMTRNDDQLNIV